MKKILLAGLVTGLLLAGTASNGVADLISEGTLYRTGGSEVGSAHRWVAGGGSSVQHSVDHIQFKVNTAGTIGFDMLSWEGGINGMNTPVDINADGEIAFMDTMIRLFRDDGSLDSADYISLNDDSNSTFVGDGSIYNRDSYMSQTLVAGNYILAVGTWTLNTADAIAGVQWGSGPITYDGSAFVVNDHGDYQVTITGDVAPVPEPATMLLFGTGLVGLAAGARRNKKK